LTFFQQNHLDHDAKMIHESNYMTNILPQLAQMNRGAWLYTEMLVECYRETYPVHVLGGAVWSNDEDAGNSHTPGSLSDMDDWFLTTHDVRTPTHFWKVIQLPSDGPFPNDGNRIAFWMDNAKDASAKNVGAYVVSLETLAEKLAERGQNEAFLVAEGELLSHKPEKVWGMPKKCDRS